MKTNQEILDHLGKLVVENIVDYSYEDVERMMFKGTPNSLTKKYHEAFQQLNDEAKNLVKEYISKHTVNVIFEFLKIFEEHEEFKLLYEENNNSVDLVKISEMLKAEILIENGWIIRFSKHVKSHEIY